MTFWVRVYPAIRHESSGGTMTSHKVSEPAFGGKIYDLEAVLCASVYRCEEQAREAAKQYGGVTFETDTSFFNERAFENRYFFLSGVNEDSPIDGEPLVPTPLDAVTVVMQSCKIDEQGALYSQEDGSWLEELQALTGADCGV